MPRMCDMTKKRPRVGNSRSHSNIASKRVFGINLQSKRVKNPATGKLVSVRLSAKAIKTLNKWNAQGKFYDINELTKVR